MQSSFFNKTFLNPDGAKISVIVQKLGDYIDHRGFNKINLIKIDIE
jgi:hypothetical protein